MCITEQIVPLTPCFTESMKIQVIGFQMTFGKA